MILQGESGLLEINILRRSNTTTNDYWDANWLESEIKIQVPGFKAHYGTNLRVDDLQRFYESLTGLEKLKKAVFDTMEEGLYLECTVLTNTIECKGKSIYESNILEFVFITNLTVINNFIAELKLTLKSYPLIGNR